MTRHEVTESCCACGDSWPSLEAYVNLDGEALCPLCAVELVMCECDLSVQRRHLQETHGGLVCPACASIAVASITVLDVRERGRANGQRRAA